MKKSYRLLSSLLITSAITLTSVSTMQAAEESAPTIGQNQNGEVLFDNTHGQTAGAADWVIDGGFSDYANSIAQQGYQVKELRGESNITPEALSGKKMLVIPEANIPFKQTEQQAMVDYVKQGGNIVFIADHYNADRNLNRIDSSEAMNGYRRGAFADITKDMSKDEKSSKAMQGVQSSDWLSDNFGIRFRYNALGDMNTTNLVKGKDGLGITDNVSSLSIHAGSTLAITNPELAKGIAYAPDNLDQSKKWSHAVDQGVYAGGGKDEGPYAAVSKVGKGKAAFIGDSSLVEDSSPKYKREDTGQSKKTYDGFKEENNGQFLQNLTKWLNKSDDSQSIKDMGVTLDNKTPLKDFEAPANSTETQAEPWSQPSPNYKWYDRSTFAAGSYGSDKQGNTGGSGDGNTGGDTNPPTDQGDSSSTIQNATFELPEHVKSGETFKVNVNIKSNQPNSTLKDLKLGIYTENGTQIGQFSADGKNFTQAGYSDSQTVKTDGSGNATLTLSAKIIKDQHGQANIRLKQGKKALNTQTITID
ncbi:DNA-binding protein [Staphylococcus caeli]|uniref:DNA-binding protein n=1 Tax=Staphylococcus caeli TaxID=2201815 RepID=UPI003F572534